MDEYQRWLNLWRQREADPSNVEMQRHLGPLEHGAWAEMMVSQNPLWSLSLLGAIPGYTAGKALGLLGPTWSPASVDEMAEGYRGVGRGLLSYF